MVTNMVHTEEVSFPRGGRKVNSSLKRSRQDDILFPFEKSLKAKKTKRGKKSQKENVTDQTFQSSLNIQRILSYSKLQDGMIILGCVKHITDLSIQVEFPGLTFGTVSITNISDCFTAYLSRRLENTVEEGDVTLKNIFKLGQFVLVKVLSIESKEKGKHVKCTMNPRDIYHETSHDSFKKGMLIWASVQSVLDHGYEINVGVKNCRVFLPSKNVDEGKIFSIGEPLWCTIHKSESTNSVTTLRVSSKAQHIKTAKIEEIDGLHNIIPGMQIEMVTDKIMVHGIQGKFINDYFGYVDETQLRHPLEKLGDYKEGKFLTAFVLYIEPSTKITYLTLRNLDPIQSINYTVGDIVSGEVISKARNGIYLKLSTNEKCFITNKRIISSLPKKPDADISKSIEAKFSVGSKHTCRILDYSYMSRVYICSTEQFVVKEKIFNSKDVKVGQLVTVIVKSIKSEGIVVTSGHVRGFVPNLHISNVEYSDNLKKKFNEGYKVNARVLNVNDGNILFTLKTSLVESDNCLTELAQAKKGNQYPGVVAQTKPSGVLVVFYGEVKGWICKYNLDSGGNNKELDPSQYFYKGQVINPWVLGVKGKKVMLTLKSPPELKNVNVKVGQRIKGIIGKIHKDRIDIKSARGKMIGTVPLNQLGCTPSLSSVLLKTYKIGDEMNELICIYNKDLPSVLSRREALVFNRDEKIKLRKFENIKPGTLLRCSYISRSEAGFYVLPLILDYNENVFVKNKDIINKGECLPKFAYHQSIVAKVLEVNYESREIFLTTKFAEVFNNSVEAAVNFFSRYLADVKYLRSFGYENDWDLCQYQPGERVNCKIEQLGDEGGCLATLPNNVKGLIAAHLCPASLKPEQILEGVFLSQDFKNNYTDLCLKPDVSQKINKIQDGIIDSSSLSSCIAEIILVKTDSIIGVLKQESCRRQLVYIPLYLNENDYNGCRNYYKKDKLKICICGKVGPYLIGISKKLFITLDKQKIHMKKRKGLLNDKEDIDLGKNKKSLQLENEKKIFLHNSTVQSRELEIISISESEEKAVNVEFETSKLKQKSKEQKATKNNTDENSSKLSNSLKNNSGVKRKRSSKNIKFGNENVKNFATSDSITGPLPVLPGISSFFNPNTNMEDEPTSDEEEETEVVKKKKKLTPAERAELARQEEERISKIEKELANSTSAPNNAEQFDRMLMANPNSSELWTKYMSFHVGATEFDKARAVAKRALESIDMTLTEERLNIWLALLNLENMFGTKGSFEKTFEEAVKYNDSLRIYLKTIEILADADKFGEMEEKIKKVRGKYKHEPTMWMEVAKTLYSKNKLKDARNIKEAALKSIQDKKIQLNLIVRFAILEFKYGEEEQGAAIFETILNSDPRKVNIWTTYIDQLVKKDRIDQARRVLERSVCQRLPLKSIKTLFLKFRMFEEQHGTPDSLEVVKEKAKEYVNRIAAK